MNDPKVIPNPAYEEIGKFYETYYPCCWPDAFDMICIGPPPTYLIDHTGQLEFSFVLDIMDLS